MIKREKSRADRGVGSIEGFFGLFWFAHAFAHHRGKSMWKLFSLSSHQVLKAHLFAQTFSFYGSQWKTHSSLVITSLPAGFVLLPLSEGFKAIKCRCRRSFHVESPQMVNPDKDSSSKLKIENFTRRLRRRVKADGLEVDKIVHHNCYWCESWVSRGENQSNIELIGRGGSG